MRSARYIVLCLALLSALAFLGPAGAAASSCGNSAGDSQYVDPLACGTPPVSSHHSGSSHGSPSTSQPVSSTSSSSPSTQTVASTATSTTTPTATSPTTPSATATTAAAGDPATKGKTLPYTGLDLVPAITIALALIGGGLVLRRLSGERSA